ncbi:uncharacterized protein LACBIDRAFT_312321 [Laccaria bicolor S238N-H82]|uniref:Predicted protein n=1 Tax=Laccaria bicolor (strain S238N-H82 / ATCC MYA-4686) TaxID=486041 RepID=B0DVY5_LACBS|nr:uncharacterized protein LACBIDRAFT_312321 [Laccaria bicolor S238N-H82]EDR01252.1 predicted protein [Laccaria bicolor S238N-H82]|eukprot:XP_001888128.1 predicted protein [Laccaria bicolor S238N-H82]
MQFSMCYQAHGQSRNNPKTGTLRIGVLPRVVERYHESISCSWTCDVARPLQRGIKISLAFPSFVACCMATLPYLASSLSSYRHKVQPTLVRISDNNTCLWKAGMRGNSRVSDTSGIKRTRSEATSYLRWW